jgi:hypothetical protein
MRKELDSRQMADLEFEHHYDDLLVDAGLMDNVLAKTHLSTSEIHLILHGNSSTLALNIFRLNQSAHIVEIQPNKFTCAQTSQLFYKMGIPHTVVGKQSYVQTGQDLIRREYAIDNSMSPMVLKNEQPQVWIVQDHVRSAKVLREFLGSQVADSASLAFQAPKITDLHESPYTCQPGKDMEFMETIIRGRATRDRTDDRALAVASQLVRAKGRLLIALLVNLKKRPAQNVTYQVDLGTHTAHWEGDTLQKGLTVRSPSGFMNYQAEIFSLLHK